MRPEHAISIEAVGALQTLLDGGVLTALPTHNHLICACSAYRPVGGVDLELMSENQRSCYAELRRSLEVQE